jgi:hypothetical protein
MEERLSILKNDFNAIIDFKENNISSLQLLGSRIKKIKEIYADFINANRENLFVFTLDSFHFQGKLIDIEYEDVLRLFYAITNRMYCDYYKLFKIIIEYVNENVPDKKLSELIKVNDNYPVYKDLEPFKQYEFHYIQSLHEIILVILTYLNTFILNKDHDLKVYQSKNKIGLNIDSFVNTFNFNNTVMKEKTTLFITYIEFFHKLHTKYLKRFTMKLQLMMSQINNDIKLDNPNETKSTKKDIINDLKENNIDKATLRELKLSVSDENSIISSDQSKTPQSRKSSNSNASDKSSEKSDPSDPSDPSIPSIPSLSSDPSIQLIVPSNTPEIMNILELSETNFELYEPTNNCEQVSELSDDNKYENNITTKYTLYKTIMEEPKELPTDEESCQEEADEEHTFEYPSEINDMTLYSITEVHKKKRNKKKKKNSTSNDINNILI